jgi:hypothetical protein
MGTEDIEAITAAVTTAVATMDVVTTGIAGGATRAHETPYNADAFESE